MITDPTKLDLLRDKYEAQVKAYDKALAQKKIIKELLVLFYEIKYTSSEIQRLVHEQKQQMQVPANNNKIKKQ